MKEILSIQGLSKSYKNVKAIRNLNLQILEGQAYGILGPNGSGKTTTLSLVTGIIRQDSGSFRWFGEAPEAGQRRSIGSLIETPHFYPYLSLVKNLRIICDIKLVLIAGLVCLDNKPVRNGVITIVDDRSSNSWIIDRIINQIRLSAQGGDRTH